MIEKILKLVIVCGLVMIGYSASMVKHENDFTLANKYRSFDEQLKEISARKYDYDHYDCKNFSMDLRQDLEKKGIGSTILVGKKNNGELHAYVGVWVEPQTGEFIGDEYVDYIRTF